MDDLSTERMAGVSGAIFLFGLAVLFMLGAFWPGILFVIWLTAIPILLAEEGWMGLWILTQAGLWMGGIAVLVLVDWLMPGLFILGGLSALVFAVAPPERMEQMNEYRSVPSRNKRKRKRSIPVPDDLIDITRSERLEELDEHDPWLDSPAAHQKRARR